MCKNKLVLFRACLAIVILGFATLVNASDKAVNSLESHKESILTTQRTPKPCRFILDR